MSLQVRKTNNKRKVNNGDANDSVSSGDLESVKPTKKEHHCPSDIEDLSEVEEEEESHIPNRGRMVIRIKGTIQIFIS